MTRLLGEVAPLSADDPALGLLQIVTESGIADPTLLPPLSTETFLAIYRGMVLSRTLDERLMALQRQGRIGFYAEVRGQEGAVLGAAAALEPRDWLMPALREGPAALYRGLPLRLYLAQIFGNRDDLSKGHQLPCHPGSRASHHVIMSSTIASQLPHAVGMAWAAKLAHDDVVVLACLGDGATSEEDFHVAANFAGVYHLPVVFFCQNNQWAISTPTTVQTASATLAVKAVAYGFSGVRVDGNDALGVYQVVKSAVDRARRGDGPTFVEALTYRVAAHSSSDDPARYRDEAVTEEWRRRDPTERMRCFLYNQGLLDEAGDAALRTAVGEEVRQAIAEAEATPPPPLHTLIEDVFAEVPSFLEEELRSVESLTSTVHNQT